MAYADARLSGRRGRAALAAGAWLLVGAALPEGQQAQREQAQAHRAGGNAATGAPLERENETRSKAGPCRREASDRNSDLCAQWKAADAAADSVLWTERSFYLELGGMLVGLVTLGAAIAAAWFAKRAADAAHVSIRPWLAISVSADEAIVTATTIRLKLTVLAKNIGQTPALDVWCEPRIGRLVNRDVSASGSVIEWPADEGEFFSIKRMHPNSGAILPGGERSFTKEFTIGTAECIHYGAGRVLLQFAVDANLSYHWAGGSGQTGDSLVALLVEQGSQQVASIPAGAGEKACSVVIVPHGKQWIT